MGERICHRRSSDMLSGQRLIGTLCGLGMELELAGQDLTLADHAAVGSVGFSMTMAFIHRLETSSLIPTKY